MNVSLAESGDTMCKSVLGKETSPNKLKESEAFLQFIALPSWYSVKV